MRTQSVPDYIKIGIVDRHCLDSEGISHLINQMKDGAILFKTIFQAENEEELKQNLKTKTPPDIILLDIDLPVKEGLDMLDWLKIHFSSIIVIIFSRRYEESVIISALKKEVRGYISKDISLHVFKTALRSVIAGGVFYSDRIQKKILGIISHPGEQSHTDDSGITLNKKELTFLRLSCKEYTYQEIANQMKVSPRTVENYREDLCRKLGLLSRIGLVVYAIKNKIYNPDTEYLIDDRFAEAIS